MVRAEREPEYSSLNEDLHGIGEEMEDRGFGRLIVDDVIEAASFGCVGCEGGGDADEPLGPEGNLSRSAGIGVGGDKVDSRRC